MARWQREALTEGGFDAMLRPLHHPLRGRSPSPSLRDREDWNRSMLLDVRVEVRDDLPRLIRGFDEPEEVEVARAHHALFAYRLHVADALPELLTEQPHRARLHLAGFN